MIEAEALPTAGTWSHHPVQLRLIDAIAAVTWREVSAGDLEPTARGPLLLVSNHFGGAADAIVLMSVLPRRPRILADDTIWRYPVARQVMEWLGAIPVHRGRSGTGGEAHSGSDNTDMFSSCHDALAGGDSVLIFPEGITREEPSIGEVKTGAARIALGALDAGVRGLRIVPVGIHYDDKAAFRSSVYVRRGDPIDLDDLVEEAGAQSVVSDDVPAEREAVDQLTALIDERLRASAPNYDDWREARALQGASEAFLRTLAPDRSVPIGLRDRLASWLAARGGTERVQESATDYRVALEQNGLDDGWAVEGEGGLRWRSVAKILTWVLMLPYALVGVIAHAVPVVLTWLVTKLKLAPAVMATVMPVAAAVLFGITWCFWGWFGWRVDRTDGVISFLLLFPISFGALVLVMERAALWWRGLRNRLYGVRRGRRAGLSELRQQTVPRRGRPRRIQSGGAWSNRVGSSRGPGGPVSNELARDVVGVLVFLPAMGVWLIAMADVFTRKDIGRRRRVVTAVLIALVFPLALLYLLGRPPSSVRRGPESVGDPRTPLIRRLETGRPALAAGATQDGRTDDELAAWIDASLDGKAPSTR